MNIVFKIMWRNTIQQNYFFIYIYIKKKKKKKKKKKIKKE